MSGEDKSLSLGSKSHVKLYNDRGKDQNDAIGYVRTSTDKQRSSLLGQILQIGNRCKENKLNLVYICVDMGISGTKPREERPGLDFLLRNVKSGDSVIIADLSRLSRNAKYSSELRHTLAEKSIKIDSIETEFGEDSSHDSSSVLFKEKVHEETSLATSKKVSRIMRAKSDVGELPTRPSYGWRYNGVGAERKVVEEEQKGLEFIRNLMKEKPDLTIPEVVKILNDPVNKIAPFRRNPKPGQEGWYYNAVRNVLVREGIRPGKRFARLSNDEKADRVERVRVKDKEDALLLEVVKGMRDANPLITCNAIATELELKEIELESGRKINHMLIKRILESAGISTSAYDPDAEKEAAELIREMRIKDPKIKPAEIMRRLTAAEVSPLGRAKIWNHYTLKKLFKKYEIP